MLPPKPKHLHLSGTGKPPPEKSRFLQTCNRLSLFLKEKGNILDLNFEFDASGGTEAKATSVDLLDEKSRQVEKFDLPQYDSSGEAITNSKTAQMTIFYQGQVLVLDDVSADRARDLMLMANNNGESKAHVEAVVQGKDSDLPIARRASLHKFLAKRKDRATGRPFQDYNGASNGHTFDLNK